MTAPTPEFRPPAYTTQEALKGMLIGWLIGAALVMLVRLAGQQLLTQPCQGRTILALLMPLVLGPGGLAFVALTWRKPLMAAVGIGFMLASLFPALFLGTRDIGLLRTSGCAGGYVVLTTPQGKGVSSVTLRGGESLELRGRLGGFGQATAPQEFTLKAVTTQPQLTVTLPGTARPAETFPITLSAAAGVPVNTFNVDIIAEAPQDGKIIGAKNTLGVEIKP